MTGFETAKRFFLEGVQSLEANDVQAAETKFARSLEILPDRASTLNNLSVVKIRLEKFTEAEALARRAIAAGDQSPEPWSNLGAALMATQRPAEALQAHDRALQCGPASAKAWLNKAMTLLELKRFDEALTACDEALKLNSSQPEILYTQSRILKELGRTEEAREKYLVSLEMRTAASPVFFTDRRASQKATVLIISHATVMDDSFKSFERLHRECLNYPGQLPARLPDEFQFGFVFETDARKPSARNRIPPPDVVINNCTNGELLLREGSLRALGGLMDSFGVPVINHPSQIIHSTRDAAAKLVADIPEVCLPKTRRFSAAGKTPETLARDIEDEFDYPLIVRSTVFQEGKGMFKLDSRDALLQQVSAGLPEEFLATQFVDSRSDSRFFRKFRAAFVRDEMVLVRVDFDTGWNVHGRKSEERAAFYLANPHLLEIEKQCCADPEAALGRPVLQALRAIRERVPLDVFGVDFDVGLDGRLVFYEANATMNLLSTAHPSAPHPPEAEARLKQAFDRCLTALAARR